MSGEDQTTPAGAPAPEATEEVKRTTVTLRYAGASQVVAEGGGATLALFGEAQRSDVRGGGVLDNPLLVREALSVLHEVVKSDFRYVPKDRTAYLAYRRMKQQSAGLGLWEAQRAFVEWMARNDPLAFAVLDPIISVHPDELFLEVFSKDEGSYAKLGIDWSAIKGSRDRACGTTNIDFTDGLFAGVQRMRSYRETKISVGREAVALRTTDASGAANEVLEKKVTVPDTWLRGFLQVQSAGTLPRTVARIAPIDLYNVLRHLRLSADPKKGGRGIRVELVPGEPPRLVLEPWELVIPTTSGPYTGRTPQVVRIWGRRRLLLLKRLLPFVQTIDLHLLGSGLPSFWVLSAGPVTFTLGLSGFTSSNWAQAVSFDLLLPRRAAEGAVTDKVIAHLAKHWVAPAAKIAADLKLEPARVLEALQVGCQRGQLMFDVAREVYRFRPITGAPLDPGRFEFRNDRERRAHDLCAEKGAVKIVTENRIHDVGLELVGKVAVAAEKREYRPELLLDDDGRVKKADCTCAFFRKHQLKEGPCEHLVALRLAEAREEARRRAQRGASRSTIVIETRTYARRHPRGEDVYQVALDRKRVKVRWGLRGQAPRIQSLVFNSVEEAQAAYFARVDDLERRGFLDATAT
ncbi:SWIM zinc finger domain protein [Minicystis rosea]|nr:SWIM zinc finger domain protein [Minicystis rosea]